MNQRSDSNNDRRGEKDLSLLGLFIEEWCRAQHRIARSGSGEEVPAGRRTVRLCPECRELLAYATDRRRRCPLDPKPACKHCPVHCYRPVSRDHIRKIMRFSGKRLMMRGRLDLLWHYFF